MASKRRYSLVDNFEIVYIAKCQKCGKKNFVYYGDPDDLSLQDFDGFVCCDCGNKNLFYSLDEEIDYEYTFVEGKCDLI